MVLYDGISSVDWFYDGVKTPEEMKQDSKYSKLFEMPCVLLDNGNGKVYRYKPLQELAINYGILVGDDPERAYNDMLSKMAGTFVNVYDVLPFLIERANFDNKIAMSIKYAYPNWKPEETYKKDWIIRYEDGLYRIGQDHTSQSNWIPGTSGTEALYSKIEITESGYEVWKAWDGVSGLYANGQIVKDPTDGRLYQSLIDNNVWGPPHEQPDYWELVEGQNGIESEPEDEYPPYVQPTGAHDAYYNGDKITWNEEHYICIAPDGVACVWDPGAYPSYWQKA